MSDLALKLIEENKVKYEQGEDARILDLGNCGLTEIPTEVGELYWLEELILCEFHVDYLNNNWVSAHARRKKWANFQKFSSENLNQISSLPDCLSNLKSLRKIAVSNEALKTCKVSDISVLGALITLESVYLANSSVSDLSPIKKFKNLQVLDLGYTPVRNLEPLSEFFSLKYLFLNDTKVSGIAPLLPLIENGLNIRKHSEFTPGIYLKNCPLNTPPSEIAERGAAAILRYFEELRGIKPISSLEISVFETKSDSVESKLGSIEIESDGIETYSKLPKRQPEVLNLLSIVTKLYSILTKFSLFKADSIKKESDNVLNTLALDWGVVNMMQIPPVYKYRRELTISPIGKESDQIYDIEIDYGEVKIIVIGESGAGKTTLIRRLLNLTTEFPTEEENSSGMEYHPCLLRESLIIEIDELASFRRRLKLPIEEENSSGMEYLPMPLKESGFRERRVQKIRLNILDLGKYSKYLFAQSIFFSHRSLYIFVDDTQTNNETYKQIYDKWLQNVELFGGGSPVLILHNEKAGRKRDGFNLGMFTARYKFIHEKLFQIDLGEDEKMKIENLLFGIGELISRLRHSMGELPDSWRSVRNTISKLQTEAPYISFEQYKDICGDAGIIDENKQKDLSGYLHDSGVFLHYQDNPILIRYIFLQPQWVMDAVYKILDDTYIVKEQRGVIYNAWDNVRLWFGSKWVERKVELLELMLEFELCYKIQDTTNYLCPQLLPEDIPSYALDVGIPLQIKFVYGIMPFGLFYRLIVRLHRHIAENQTAVWKSGVFLERHGAKAKITESMDRRIISVEATGLRAKELVTVIHNEIEGLHERFGERLQVDIQIPCNCEVCRVSEKPHFYDYDNLMRRKYFGKSTIECDRSFKPVSVQGLIDGVFEEPVLGGVEVLPNSQTIDKLSLKLNGDVIVEYERERKVIHLTPQEAAFYCVYLIHTQGISYQELGESGSKLQRWHELIYTRIKKKRYEVNPEMIKNEAIFVQATKECENYIQRASKINKKLKDNLPSEICTLCQIIEQKIEFAAQSDKIDYSELIRNLSELPIPVEKKDL